MKNLNVQYAVMCLQELDRTSPQFLSAVDLSRQAGVPVQECEVLLAQLAEAGVLECQGNGYALFTPAEDLKVFDIMNALSVRKPSLPAFQWLYGGPRIAQRKTLEAVRWAQSLAAFPSDSGCVRS